MREKYGRTGAQFQESKADGATARRKNFGADGRRVKGK